MTAQEKHQAIMDHLAKGKDARVVLYTCLKAVQFAPKHADYLKVSGESLYMRSGRNWLCADGCGIKFGRMVRK